MKKSYLIAMVVVVAMIAACAMGGCAAMSSGSGEGATQSGKTVKYSFKGKDLTISVEENPTTGYQWTYVVNADGSDSTGLAETGNEYQAPANSQNMTGAPGVHVFKFGGTEKGSFDIVFTSTRPWEASDDDESFVINVSLKDSGVIESVSM